MRPALVRAFSTTRRIAKQQLFEPYHPPLNERQKKALRKIARQNEPNFNGFMNKDADWIISAFNRSNEQKQLLADTLKRLQVLVKEHAGSQYDVIDIGMHTYALHIHDAPFEFAIVDKSRPDGFSPFETQSKLPIAYDASRLAEILQKDGFTGGFWCPPWDMGRLHHSRTLSELIIPTERDLTIPWPHYRRPTFREMLYPVRLMTKTPVAFSLALPGPSIIRLHKLLKIYFEYRGDSLKHLLSLLFVWTRSHRIDELTTQCLALMVVRFMQEKDKVPNILNPQDPMFSPKGKTLAQPSHEKFWVPFHHEVSRSTQRENSYQPREWQVDYIPLEYSLVDHIPPRYPKKAGSIFWDFVNFWCDGGAVAKTYALSVGQDKYLVRKLPPLKDRERELELSDVFQNLTDLSRKNLRPDDDRSNFVKGSQPLTWPLHPLIVQDPFIPTYNHADSVSRESLHVFVRQAKNSSRDLAYSWPFATVFGENFLPPRAEMENKFKAKRSFDITPMRGYHVSAVLLNHNEFPSIVEPPEPVLETRAKTLRRVQHAIGRKYGSRYRVKAFGSTQYGVSSANSDLDLVILDLDRQNGFLPTSVLDKLPDIYNIKKLARVLWSAGFTNVVPIVTANVPIVKFRDKISGLDCDISVNERLGWINTGMISRYCDIIPILRPMVGFIKQWAKPLGLNSPSAGGPSGSPTFSSYALMLMTISFLQSRGLAPNLQEGFEHRHDDYNYFWTRIKRGRGPVDYVQCDTRYHLAYNWNSTSNMDYKDVLLAWYRYWGTKHDYNFSAVNIREGGFLHASPSPSKKDTYHFGGDETEASQDILTDNIADPPLSIYVIDPFIRDKIVTKNINAKSLKLFQVLCQRTEKLLNEGATLEEILARIPENKNPNCSKDSPVSKNLRTSTTAASSLQVEPVLIHRSRAAEPQEARLAINFDLHNAYPGSVSLAQRKPPSIASVLATILATTNEKTDSLSLKRTQRHDDLPAVFVTNKSLLPETKAGGLEPDGDDQSLKLQESGQDAAKAAQSHEEKKGRLPRAMKSAF